MVPHQKRIFIANGKRTPFGKFGGGLKAVTPVDLAVHAAKGALQQIGLAPDKIDQVILANVCPSSTDTLYGGRHLALKLGCKEETPGKVVNRLCGSGIEVILDAARSILLDESECVLIAGTENMSMIPHLVYGSRFGTKFGSLETKDMLWDALTDQYAGCPMGITAENLGEKYNISKEASDEFSYKSHMKAAKAYQTGVLQGEIAAYETKRGIIEQDEHLRADVNLEQLKSLKPTFKKDGLVTAGSASGIVDGAASLVIVSESFCEKEGLTPLAEIKGGTVVGVDPSIMGIGPYPAITKLLAMLKLDLKSIDLVEINEAFAAQTLACQKALELDPEKLNVWGGAVALGHPLGATGARITLTLCRQLQVLGQKRGIASACIGGGQGIAIMVERV